MCVELNSKAREKEDVFREKPKKPKKKKQSRERFETSQRTHERRTFLCLSLINSIPHAFNKVTPDTKTTTRTRIRDLSTTLTRKREKKKSLVERIFQNLT
jgi:hypothetical protein